VEVRKVGRVHTFGLLIGCKSGFLKKKTAYDQFSFSENNALPADAAA
jgi:hypothetical protein